MAYSTLILCLLLLSLVANVLLWRHNSTMRKKVSFLFSAIDNGDYAFRFPTDRRKDDRQLNASLNRIKEILQHARNEQIEREKYYEVILNSVDTGILVVDDSRGLVLRTNQAALRLLGRESISHITQVQDRLKAFAIRESFTRLKGRRVRIIGFSDIHGELANQEVDAWVKLIRVLTHEIMNTITPIIALSETPPLPSPKVEGVQTPDNVSDRLRIIHDTSRELMAFVENYRKFTHVPNPTPTVFYVKPFLERQAQLARHLLAEDCQLSIDVEPKDLLVYSDEGLLSRVVSNLLKNAAEATLPHGHINVHAYSGRQEAVTIDISDDGEPIPKDIIPHIFVPFFTTKKGGSGIGLSISRQIMRAMGDTIELVTDKRQTTFRLTFT